MLERLEEGFFNHLLQQLPFPIQNKVIRYRKWEDKQRSLFGKLLLIKGLRSVGLNSYSLKDLKYTRFLKPYFDNHVDFNISHSGEYTICAISETSKIGIDVEMILDIPLIDFDSQFSQKEWQTVLQAKNPLHYFYTLWTMKESFLKAIGSGLNVPLNEVNIKSNKIIWEGKEWFLHELPLDQNHISYLSADIPTPKIVMEKIDFNRY